MTPDPNSEQLLNDIFEQATPEFGSALLEKTLAAVRQRRRLRRANRVLAALALVMLASIWLWHGQNRDIGEPSSGAGAGRTTPAFVAVVETRSLARDAVVTSRTGFVPELLSSPGGVQIVQSDDLRPAYQELTDDELLSLCVGRAVALVRHGPRQADLLFLDGGQRADIPTP